MAVDKFEQLETRIIQTIELLKTTRKEKDGLEKELASARKQVARLENELSEFRRDRALIENKVASLLETLSELAEESVV